MQEIKVQIKSVYGRELVYPVCETAQNFAKLLNVKTFTNGQLYQIQQIGFLAVNVATNQYYFNQESEAAILR